jgi:hypothetical protein
MISHLESKEAKLIAAERRMEVTWGCQETK